MNATVTASRFVAAKSGNKTPGAVSAGRALGAIRVVDVAAAAVGLIVASPVLLPTMFLVWRQDRHSPFYIAARVGKGGADFRMVKLRSMVVGADRSGVDSTAGDDVRITSVGRFIRRFKLDELTQLWNVLKGEMSLVGPRPNVRRETDLYTEVERQLLSVKPGITDFASIVFADEGEVLRGASDPDTRYHQLIRPGKNRLALFYIEKQSLGLDIRILALTGLAMIGRQHALIRVSALLERLGAEPDLVDLARRDRPLQPSPPPGSRNVIDLRPSPDSDPVSTLADRGRSTGAEGSESDRSVS